MLFADDIVICTEDCETWQASFEQWQHCFEQAGLSVNVGKTEDMMSGGKGLNIEDIAGREIRRIKQFKYLGLLVVDDSALISDAQHYTKAVWCKWWELTPVLCDKKMPLKCIKLYLTHLNVEKRNLTSHKKINQYALHHGNEDVRMVRWLGTSR